MRLISRVFAAALALCANPVLAAEKQEALTLLRPDAVFDGESAVLHKGWAVLVRGNRIEAVGPDLAAPAQASDDHTAGPLSPASLHLLDLRFRALTALAPDPQPSPDSGGTKATVPGLAEVVDAVMNARQAQAREQRCELAAHVDPRLAGHGPPDAGRLHDALELLLASAIAISPSGRVQLKLMASPDAIDIDLTDSAREPVDGSNLDCIIAARLIERLGARLRTQFTAGVGHWHHVRLVLASPDTPGREPATTSECS